MAAGPAWDETGPLPSSRSKYRTERRVASVPSRDAKRARTGARSGEAHAIALFVVPKSSPMAAGSDTRPPLGCADLGRREIDPSHPPAQAARPQCPFLAGVAVLVIFGPMTRARRYELPDAELNRRIDDLLAQAQRVYGEIDGADFVRQILASGVRLVSDRTARADLALLNSALKELRHAFRVFEPFAHVRKVSVFGSARTRPDPPEWTHAFR